MWFYLPLLNIVLFYSFYYIESFCLCTMIKSWYYKKKKNGFISFILFIYLFVYVLKFAWWFGPGLGFNKCLYNSVQQMTCCVPIHKWYMFCLAFFDTFCNMFCTTIIITTVKECICRKIKKQKKHTVFFFLS